MNAWELVACACLPSAAYFGTLAAIDAVRWLNAVPRRWRERQAWLKRDVGDIVDNAAFPSMKFRVEGFRTNRWSLRRQVYLTPWPEAQVPHPKMRMNAAVMVTRAG